jgi:predicted nucleic-acid-binding Zn-ribbon protein
MEPRKGKTMQRGRCSKCAATTVRVRTIGMGLLPTLAFGGGTRDVRPLFLSRIYVCTTCGYSELYARENELKAISTSQEWDDVPWSDDLPHAPMTGDTIRLEP